MQRASQARSCPTYSLRATSRADGITGNDQGDGLPALAEAERAEPKPGGLASYLEDQWGAGAGAYAIESLTKTLKQAAARIAVMPKFTDTVADWDEQRRLFEQAARNLELGSLGPGMKSFTAKVAEDLRVLDRAGERFRLFDHWPAVADWSQQTLGFTALTSWRTSLAVESHFEQMMADTATVQFSQSNLVKDLASITKAQVNFTDWVVQQDASSHLLGEISGRPLGLWRGFVDSLPAEPDDRVLLASVTTGRVGLGLLGADVLQTGVDDADFVEVAVEHVESDVLAPWQQGRLDAVGELYARIVVIEPTVPELLQGAWEDVQRDGPAAASKAAHCCVEALDRTLRAAAPEDAVRQWHAATGRPANEFTSNGKPTRAVRVRYIVRAAGGVKKLIVEECESLTTLLAPLMERLEAVKHASIGDVMLTRSLLMATECFLLTLLSSMES